MKPIEQQTMDELRETYTGLARVIEAYLPPGELFCCITFGNGEPGEGQYVGNAGREGMIEAIREVADRMEARQDVRR